MSQKLDDKAEIESKLESLEKQLKESQDRKSKAKESLRSHETQSQELEGLNDQLNMEIVSKNLVIKNLEESLTK